MFLMENRRINDGSISINFGAINRSDSGYKRLNVAISRAKKGLILISSFRSNEVDWFRSDKRGIKMLEKFIKNAEYGVNVLEDTKQLQKQMDSTFEHEVYKKLVAAGLEVKFQVGTSGFRIDLAIVHKNNPNKYVLGIECDGATFHSSKSARDRDRLRQQVLESRGWNIHRIWSTDWFKNPNQQIDLILRKLDDIYSNNKILEPIDEQIVSFADEISLDNDYLDLFEDYLNIEQFIEENKLLFRSSREGDKVNIIKNLLLQTGPIKEDKFNEIIKKLLSEPRINNEIKQFAKRLIRPLASFDMHGFYVPINNDFEFKFKKSNSKETKRLLNEIHPNELEHLFLKMLKTSKISISLDDFCRELSYLTQSQVSQLKNKEYILEILNNMAQNNLINKISHDVFEMKKDS
ncbi:DUF559 domain-containing protein [Ureaplasma diversum]|uniref:DUF559 domain-containing protein n=1 Tax=Ureaplasma diversum TaxID=42094 RepID=UPI002B279605|nr:DUF559 domain-containing protein [Ureaplasma diversum]